MKTKKKAHSNKSNWTVELINESRWPLPYTELQKWVLKIEKTLVRFANQDRDLAKKLKLFNKFESELTVVLLSEKRIQQLNQEFRHKDKPTDVLSFSSEFSLGELIFCPQVIKKQAPRFKHSAKQEFCYMLIHGVLHLMGYDHEDDPQAAQQMFSLQDKIFKKFLF